MGNRFIYRLSLPFRACLRFFVFLGALFRELPKIDCRELARKSFRLIKINRKDALVILGCASFLVFFSFSLYSEIYKKRNSYETEKIGFVIAKKNTVQRKYSSDLSWEKIEKKYPLYNLDKIRSGDDSIALLKLKDGTEIEMEENSLIVVNYTEEKGELDFVEGSVRAKGAKKDMLIRSKGKRMNIKDGELHLRASKEEDKAVVFVKRGEMQMLNQAGKVQVIKEKQQVFLDKKKTLVQFVSVELQKPSGGERIPSEGKYKLVHFQWKGRADQIQEGGREFLLEISLDRNFSRTLMKRRSKKNSAALRLAAASHYYWRVSFAKKDGSGKRNFSNINKFSLLKTEKIKLEYPYNNQVFKMSQGSSGFPLSFAWTDDETANSYTLKISRTKPSNIIQEKTLKHNSIRLDLTPGVYYWQVIKTTHFSKGEQRSNLYKFSIIESKDKEALVLQLLSPRKNESLHSGIIDREGIPFHWNMGKSIKNLQFQLAADKNFTKIVFSNTVRVDYFHFKKKLALGTYYWRVKGIDIETDFRTSHFKLLDYRLPFKTLAPKRGALFDVKKIKKEGLLFEWKGLAVDLKGRFEISISRAPNFKRIYHKEEVKERRQVRIKNLESGKYFWRVRLKDPLRKKILAQSNRSYFEISSLDTIEMKDGEVIVGVVVRQGSASISVKKYKDRKLRMLLIRDIKRISFAK